MEEVKVNVMMFGGKRCGKTSVIAAMKDCFGEVFKQDLSIFSSDATSPILEDKLNEIKDSFNLVDKGRTFSEDTADYSGTSEINEYNISIQLKKLQKGKSLINLNFIDYPGEWIKNNRGDVSEIMKKSRIIMITIDTPFLMEQTRDNKSDSVGRYNNKRNFCDAIAEMLQKSFSSDVNDQTFPIMIMFVPLKCEKYYNAGKMNLVNEKIHAAYKKVFDFVSDKYRKIFEVAITPILSFGPKGIEFSRFETDENGEIKENAAGIPANPIYIFKAPKKEDNKYSPLYCEQPILYSLAYLLSVAEKAKKEESWFVCFFTEFFGGAASLYDFMEQKKKIIKNLKTEGDGFEIFQDPLGFKE
jgi:hypothetical protein